jgi:hypothetical protein
MFSRTTGLLDDIGQTEKKKATKRVGILRRVDRISHKLPQPNFQL